MAFPDREITIRKKSSALWAGYIPPSIGGTDGFYYINSTNHFVNENSLDNFDEYADGTPIGVNKFFPIVWGVVRQDGHGRLVAVLPNAPSTEYASAADADIDNEGITNYFPPDSSLKRIFLPIAKTVIKKQVAADVMI